MDRVFGTYKRWLGFLLTTAVVLHLIGIKYVAAPIEHQLAASDSPAQMFSSVLMFLLTSTGLYTGVCFLGLWLFERILWKKWHKELDLEGVWQTEFVYDASSDEVARGGKPISLLGQAFVSQSWDGQVAITGSFSLVLTEQNVTGVWESTSCVVTAKSNSAISLILSFTSRRSGDSTILKPGELVKGVEELVVLHDQNGRPVELRGVFYGYYPSERKTSGQSIWRRIVPIEKQAESKIK